MSEAITPDELRRLDAWWRAANYLSVGQIYLLDNPLLHDPLRLEHVKPRLLGHWGTSPGLNFVYVHANRAIRAHDLDAIYVIGPGHGGPAIVAKGRRVRRAGTASPQRSRACSDRRRRRVALRSRRASATRLPPAAAAMRSRRWPGSRARALR
jgi:xylulose-5-phosphate/fructose-6-phosphate phosphoketolase